ncbi:MAG: hypothetical protein NVS3B20_17280 [Polyangiales bacterium]
MPLPLAPLVAALIGVAFGLIGRDEIRRTSASPFATRGFLIVALCSLLLLGPALGYFIAFYPDWAYAYLLQGERVPSAFDLLEVVVIALIPPAAFAWTARALRRHAVRELVRGAAALVVLLAVAVALTGPRLIVATTFQTFREGYDLKPIGGTSLGVSILWIDGCLLAGLMWAASRLRLLARG